MRLTFALPIPLPIPLTLALLCAATILRAEEASSLTSQGITWTFAEPRPSGTFCTGDPWVLAPVTIISISTDLHAEGFAPEPGQNGSMLNPGVTGRQGYDNRLTSYDASLNAGLIDGQPIAAERPLRITEPAALVSMVSWLYRSESDAEPGIPGFNGGTKAPRPVTRSGAVLTILAEVPADGSFRPPYSGPQRVPRFTVADLKLDRLRSLAPVAHTPDPAVLARRLRGPWIDHVYEYLGAMVHPSQNMPNYGRDMAKIIVDAALLLQVDAAQVSGWGDKTELALRLVQLGIDCAGIADAGGGWRANGGHHLGRKLPILIAGALLDDPHLLSVGEWSTEFQEDQQTFYVDDAAIAVTNSPKWNPDRRAADKKPYTAADIGMPEWGIRHAYRPEADNRGWRTPYRDINAPLISGFVLAASVMDLRAAWKHEALFDYGVRVQRMAAHNPAVGSTNGSSPFLDAMWQAYATDAIPEPAWYRAQAASP